MPGRSMGELIEGGNFRRLLDPLLIKALGHPVREHILAVLNERIASASEIGEELGAEVSAFYHHVEELERLGCIEKVETRRRRGANEHFYRAKRTLFFDDTAWSRLPETLKADITTSLLQDVFEDAVAALEARTFDARDDRHMSWSSGRLDAIGWKAVTGLMNEALERLSRIRAESAGRLAAAGEEGIPATVAIMAFETAAERGRSRPAPALEPGRRRASAR
jgi:DNA-binding transcriptional ArsR family regulator